MPPRKPASSTTPAAKSSQTRLAGVNSGAASVRSKRTPGSGSRAPTKQADLFAFGFGKLTPSPTPQNIPTNAAKDSQGHDEHRRKRQRMTPDVEIQQAQPDIEIADSQFAAVPSAPLTPPAVEEPTTPPANAAEVENGNSSDEEMDDGQFQPHFTGYRRTRILQITPKKPKRPLVVPSSYTPKVAGVGRVGSPVEEEQESPTKSKGGQPPWMEEETVVKPPEPATTEPASRGNSAPPAQPAEQQKPAGSDSPTKVPETSVPPSAPPERPPLFPRDRVIPSSQWYEREDSDMTISTQSSGSRPALPQVESFASTSSIQSNDAEPTPPPSRRSDTRSIPNSVASSGSSLGLARHETIATEILDQSPKEYLASEPANQEKYSSPDTLDASEPRIDPVAEPDVDVVLNVSTAEHEDHDERDHSQDCSQQRNPHNDGNAVMERCPSPDEEDYGFHPVRTQMLPAEGFYHSQSQLQSQLPSSQPQFGIKLEPQSQSQSLELSQSQLPDSMDTEPPVPGDQSQMTQPTLVLDKFQRSSVDMMPPPPQPVRSQRLSASGSSKPVSQPSNHSSASLPSPSPAANISATPIAHSEDDDIPDTADTEHSHGGSYRDSHHLLTQAPPSSLPPQSSPPASLHQPQPSKDPDQDVNENNNNDDDENIGFSTSPPRPALTVSQLLPPDLMETFPRPPDWMWSSDEEGSEEEESQQDWSDSL